MKWLGTDTVDILFLIHFILFNTEHIVHRIHKFFTLKIMMYVVLLSTGGTRDCPLRRCQLLHAVCTERVVTWRLLVLSRVGN